MKINEAGLALIKEFEGLRLNAYPDPGSGHYPYTIGYGSTKHVRPDMQITEEEADHRLREDVHETEQAVTDFVEVELTENQFSALCAFVFNVGREAFRTSTLLRLLNTGDYAAASQQFGRWNKAGGRVMAGLTRRRQAEKELFLT